MVETETKSSETKSRESPKTAERTENKLESSLGVDSKNDLEEEVVDRKDENATSEKEQGTSSKHGSRTELMKSDHSLLSQEEVSSSAEPSEQVPPNHLQQGGGGGGGSQQSSIVVMKHSAPIFEKCQSDENLEVVPCSSAVFSEILTPFDDSQDGEEGYNYFSDNDGGEKENKGGIDNSTTIGNNETQLNSMQSVSAQQQATTDTETSTMHLPADSERYQDSSTAMADESDVLDLSQVCCFFSFYYTSHLGITINCSAEHIMLQRRNSNSSQSLLFLFCSVVRGLPSS